MPELELTSVDGHRVGGHRADPAGAARGGIVLVQEIFGVNRHIRAVADGFAAEGYLAVAPALFDRLERRIELGYTQADIERGREIVGRLDPAGILADVAAAVEAAATAGRVGVIGYCFGGAIAWLAAARAPGLACAVSYYGSRIAQFKDERPRVPLMMHVGAHDASFPREVVADIATRHPDIIVHEYDAGHGFNCTERADFQPAAARLALERTLEFFRRHIG